MLTQPDQPQEQPSLEPQPELQQAPRNNRKKTLIIAGAAILIIVLAGAAYLAGTLMNGKNIIGNGPLAQILGPSNGGNVTVKNIIGKDQIIPAKELPTVQADVRGLYVNRNGNSITIGTGNVTIGVMKSSSGGATPQASYTGPAYEVVITKDTLIYKDTTTFDPGASSTAKIQQTVAPGSLDELNSITDIAVWGKKTGDRYVADIIVYSSPMMKMNGGSGGSTK